ncbi:uncharacterized protein LOC129593025 isoform X1 [Paramacrobiotus metropolitanus]|uniref:uncharacterized protein LOC129593025 isoform X1 n=1 Tax=Paramacrobiotus metropolitanus TaxID=2943436 RepID=UPI00244651C6|nr:uncharacterized protein LOC129593025 isoform X1 [Paramacrobiotus metropolitanus]
MKSAAAIITLWATVTLLLHYSGAESGNPGVEFGLNKINTGNGIVKSGSDADRPTRKKRSLDTNVLKRFLCSDPLMTSGCSRCEKSCANPNPSPLCASNCDSTCICKPGLYRTFVPSPTCAPQNGPLLNNCKGNPQLRKG